QRPDGINISGAKREHAVIEFLARRLVEHGGSRLAIEPIEASSNQSPADMLREAGAGRRNLTGQAPPMLRTPEVGNREWMMSCDGGSPECCFRTVLITILHPAAAFGFTGFSCYVLLEICRPCVAAPPRPALFAYA